MVEVDNSAMVAAAGDGNLPPPPPAQQRAEHGEHHHQRNRQETRQNQNDQRRQRRENRGPSHQLIEMARHWVLEEDSADEVSNADNCYCAPNRVCCFPPCSKLGSTVELFSFADGFIYTCVTIFVAYNICALDIKQKQSTMKDSLWMLFAAYFSSAVVGWTLLLCIPFMKRWPGIFYMVCNTYASALLIGHMVWLKVEWNYMHAVPLAIRVYEMWLVFSWDRYLLRRRARLNAMEDDNIHRLNESVTTVADPDSQLIDLVHAAKEPEPPQNHSHHNRPHQHLHLPAMA